MKEAGSPSLEVDLEGETPDVLTIRDCIDVEG